MFYLHHCKINRLNHPNESKMGFLLYYPKTDTPHWTNQRMTRVRNSPTWRSIVTPALTRTSPTAKGHDQNDVTRSGLEGSTLGPTLLDP